MIDTPSMYIVACIPTMSSRTDVLGAAIKSLYGQVDHLFIVVDACDNLGVLKDNVPELCMPKVHIIDAMSHKGSSGRFVIGDLFPDDDAFLFFCDDDLIYPCDYVERTLAGARKHGFDAVYTYHGRKFSKWSLPLTSYFRDRPGAETPGRINLIYPCRELVSHDVEVDIVGTGALAYHTSALHCSHCSFTLDEANADDVAFSILARQQRVRAICLAHKADWLLYNEPKGWTIWGDVCNDLDKQQAQLDQINNFKWFKE